MLSHLHASKNNTLKYWQTQLLWNTCLHILGVGWGGSSLFHFFQPQTLYIYLLFTHVQQRSSSYFDHPQCWTSLVSHCVWHTQLPTMTKDASRLQGLVGLSSQMCPLVAGPLCYQRQKRAEFKPSQNTDIPVNTREAATKKPLWSAYSRASSDL